MNAELRDALRLLAGLIAEDIRAGRPVLRQGSQQAEGGPRRRGRPAGVPFAVSAEARGRAA